VEKVNVKKIYLTPIFFNFIVIKKLGGLLMTAFLITFGAPFWNDILNALVGVKNITSRGK
jgi:cytochrome c oxidase assembly factor CtaG